MTPSPIRDIAPDLSSPKWTGKPEHAMHHDNRKTPLRTKGLLILFGISLALLTGEASLRLFHPFPKYADLTVPNAEFGFHLRPGAIGRSSDRMGEYDTEIRVNHDGFRDSTHSLQKPENTLRMAFLGDSFTLANQVEESECFIRLLEKSIQQRWSQSGRKLTLECMNFGIGGFDTQQQVLCYESCVRKYKPDVVVLMMYPHNDLIGNVFYRYEKNFGRPYFQLDQGALKFVPADPAILKANHEKSMKREALKWYHYLHLYNAQKNVLYGMRQNGKVAPPPAVDFTDPAQIETFWKRFGFRKYRYYASSPLDSLPLEIDDITHLLLSRLASDVAADQGKFLVALLPAAENLWPDQWPSEVKKWPGLEQVSLDFNKPFKKIPEFLPELEAHGDILDLRPALNKENMTHPVFFQYDFHYNKFGHQAVAHALCEWLEPKLSISKTK